MNSVLLALSLVVLACVGIGTGALMIAFRNPVDIRTVRRVMSTVIVIGLSAAAAVLVIEILSR